MRGLTIAALRLALREYGATLRVADGELAVTVAGSTYYTNDRDDALGTARAMWTELVSMEVRHVCHGAECADGSADCDGPDPRAVLATSWNGAKFVTVWCADCRRLGACDLTEWEYLFDGG